MKTIHTTAMHFCDTCQLVFYSPTVAARTLGVYTLQILLISAITTIQQQFLPERIGVTCDCPLPAVQSLKCLPPQQPHSCMCAHIPALMAWLQRKDSRYICVYSRDYHCSAASSLHC